ncbi:MAG: hypothetical protein KA212_01800 [Burkholderiaceae bacterium]|nr:hypothetical protein [Xylophilus sp.]MBP6559009.1 hypothetical protein [Burkholderiaceae bacterium]MBP6616454.1 hypothetical protein [Burkholderiaceae bacterium]MBP6651800.1 hypothetical protein [Xylophilus sp.]MBP7420710.1 hypothetical protein [Burkholderiaceae bacterium]
MKIFSLSAVCAVSVLCASAAFAKLPAPDDAAKAKAAEAAAKAAWTGKVDNYLLCNAQDRAAANFFANAKAEGREVKPAIATPPCADPGPFAYVAPEAKPLEAAGAHSPATTAASPPSGPKTAAELAPAKK